MSNAAIDWAIATSARGSAKAVLFVMANQVRDKAAKSYTGKTWPPHHTWMSHGSIANQAGIDVKTVPAALAKLEAGGLIECAGTDGGTGQVKVYRLAVKDPENGGVSDDAKTPESGDLQGTSGGVQRSPVSPAKVPAFSVKGPRFRRERSPKTGDETQTIEPKYETQVAATSNIGEQPDDLFPESAGADRAPTVSVSSKRSKGAPKPQPEARSAPAWEAYAAAWSARHGADPIRGKVVNSQLCKLVDAVGVEDAARLAAYFVEMDHPPYLSRMHPVAMLVQDAQSIRALMVTGRAASDMAGSTFHERRQAAAAARVAEFAPSVAAKTRADRQLQTAGLMTGARRTRTTDFTDIDYREGLPDGT